MHPMIKLFGLIAIIFSISIVGGCTSEDPPEPQKTVVKKINVKPPTPSKTTTAQAQSPSLTPSSTVPQPSPAKQPDKTTAQANKTDLKPKPDSVTKINQNEKAPSSAPKAVSATNQTETTAAPPSNVSVPKKKQPPEAKPSTTAKQSELAKTSGVPEEDGSTADLLESPPASANDKAPEKSGPSKAPQLLAQKTQDQSNEEHAPDIDSMTDAVEGPFEVEETNSSYNPRGGIDPFKPFIEKKEPEPTGPPKKELPKGPLQQVDLAQLDLVGIIRAPSGNLALVQMANGKGYIIQKGTAIGDKQGRVAEILADRVVVEEKGVDSHNEPITKERLMKIQKPIGEL